MKLFERTDTDNKIERDQKEILEEELGRDCGKINEEFRTDLKITIRSDMATIFIRAMTTG